MSADPRRAGPQDADTFARTFGTVMYDDPMIRWPLPADVDVETVIAMTRPVVSMYLQVEAAWMIGDGLAVAAWIAPDAAARFDELEHPTRAAIAPFTDDGGARYGQFWDWLAEHIPTEPCWYLDLVAVHPVARGRGLGRQMVEHGLALARHDGVPAFLETSRASNLPFYERLGFSVIAEEAAPGGGPTIWFMRT